MLQFIKNPMNNEKLDKEVINDETIFYLNVSKVLDSINEGKEQEERFDKKKYDSLILLF